MGLAEYFEDGGGSVTKPTLTDWLSNHPLTIGAIIIILIMGTLLYVV